MTEPNDESKHDVTLRVIGWIWGAAQGEFNEEQAVAQIITDATVSMLPVVITAMDVWNLLAASQRIIDDSKKREDVFEWAMLVALVAALIPVEGSAIKGVGRLLLRAAQRGDDIDKAPLQVIEMMNRTGIGNAEKWLCEFSFGKYAKPLSDRFAEWMRRLRKALEYFILEYGEYAPESVVRKVRRLIVDFKKLQKDSSNFWDKAILYLDDLLGQVKEKIRPDGTGASKDLEHNIPVCEAPITRAPESQQRDVLTFVARTLPNPPLDVYSPEAEAFLARFRGHFPG